MGYGYGGWKPYVPVAKRRRNAEMAAAKAKKAGADYSPVFISGRAIAKTFWGKAWCDNLEAYSDYENRLPRGRAYVRNGSVIDLKIEPGKVKARVMGSDLYQVEIDVDALPAHQWQNIAQDCTGSIASLVELLQGKLSGAVMERICQPGKGLFPSPKEIHLGCSCPDWASMCKHVAAVLYGVGARLDQQPELLFTLRKVDANELVIQAVELPVKTKKAPAKSRMLDDSALADVFGIEMADPAGAGKGSAEEKKEAPTKPRTRRKTATAKPAEKSAALPKKSSAGSSAGKARKKEAVPADAPMTPKPATRKKAARTSAKPAPIAETSEPQTPPPAPKRSLRARKTNGGGQ